MARAVNNLIVALAIVGMIALPAITYQRHKRGFVRLRGMSFWQLVRAVASAEFGLMALVFQDIWIYYPSLFPQSVRQASFIPIIMYTIGIFVLVLGEGYRVLALR